MAAIRFRGEFRTSTNLLYTIDIYDQEYNGSVVPFKLGSQGFRLQYRGENNNMFTPIVGSELEFDMMIEDATHEQFITDIAASPESRFWIGIYKGPGAQDLWWCGIVTPDIARSEDAAYPFAFSVRAVDGLGLLKTIDYASDEGLSVTGVERIITIIERCLNFLPHISHYYNQSDFFINTSVNWYENSHSYTNTYDPLYYTYANNFVTSSADDQAQWYNENNFKYLTVYEVLSSLLTIFGARITHYGGVFYIEQIETRTSDTFFSRRYGYPVVSPVAIDLQGTTSIASNQQVRRKLTGGTFTWFPSLKKATLTYKTKNRRNFWPPFRWGFLGGYGNNDFIERDTGIDINIQFPQQLIFSGNLRFTINSASYATSQIAPGSSYLIVAYIGVIAEESPGNTKSLLRQATDNGFSIVYGPTRWELGNTSRYAFAGSFFKMPETGDAPLSMNIPISFTTPHIQGTLGAVVGRLKLSFTIGLYGPDADDNYTFNFLDPDLMQDYNWALQNPFMELTAVGFQNTSTNEKIYTIISDTVGSTAEYEATVFWADGDTVNTVGRLQTESGGVYTDTDSWGVKTTSGNKLIQELLLERMMRMQRNPVMKYDGTVYGPDFAIYKTLVDTQSRKWMFLAGSYTANLDQWQGEWANIGVYSSGTFEIIATDAEMFPGGYYPAGPVVDTSTESIVPGNIAPATLEPLAAAVVAVSYPSGGAPGSGISINSVLGAGAFVQGQQIAIVNPSSGQFAYFEVTSDSIAGDTTIGISGSFPSRFPAGSYVINLPSNYTVSGGVGPAQGGGGGFTGILPIASGGTGASGAPQALTNLGATTVGGNIFTLPNQSEITFIRINANNTITTRNPLQLHLDLGATTVGRNIYSLLSINAVSFLRINANNTVTARSAADFRSDIGVGTGNGTVTSVGLTAPNIFTVSGSPITASGSFGVSLNAQNANSFFAGPSGASGVPAFRAIVPADVPTLNQNTTGTAANVTGIVAVANGGTGASGQAQARTNLGATTVGGNIFTLPNPGAVSFIQLNSDNTVATLSASGMRNAIGAVASGDVFWESEPSVGGVSYNRGVLIENDTAESFLWVNGVESYDSSVIIYGPSGQDQYNAFGGQTNKTWYAGRDGSDSGKYKIGLGGNVFASGAVEIDTNRITYVRQIGGFGSLPTFSLFSNAGSTATVSASGNSHAFLLDITTQGSGILNGDILEVTIPVAYPNLVLPTLTPANVYAIDPNQPVGVINLSNNKFRIRFHNTPFNGDNYTYVVHINGY